ncbi:hypothetical protein M758_5G074200, partial [Ceratodon purpureus]
ADLITLSISAEYSTLVQVAEYMYSICLIAIQIQSSAAGESASSAHHADRWQLHLLRHRKRLENSAFQFSFETFWNFYTAVVSMLRKNCTCYQKSVGG